MGRRVSGLLCRRSSVGSLPVGGGRSWVGPGWATCSWGLDKVPDLTYETQAKGQLRIPHTSQCGVHPTSWFLAGHIGFLTHRFQRGAAPLETQATWKVSPCVPGTVTPDLLNSYCGPLRGTDEKSDKTILPSRCCRTALPVEQHGIIL